MNRLLAAALCFVSCASLAQGLECNPSSPRTDPGTGFTPFAALERLEVRSGRPGAQDWEWGIGVNTQSAGQFASANLDWVNNRVYSWTLSYSGTGSATVEVRDGGTLLFSRSWASGMLTGNALKLYVKSTALIGAGNLVSASSATINGFSAAGTIQTAGDNSFSEGALYWYFPGMSGGFVATGTVTMTFTGSYPPQGSRLNFIVTAGNIACTPSNAPPTVSIDSPAANASFGAPASIAVSAQASDPDGTVSSVQFFANGAPIGTATASPFTITWANVAAGAYSLTAVATDNSGASTTSAAVPISVTANEAKLYFIQTDHLNTPRLITDANQQVRWRWDQQEPFGVNVPDENPAGQGAFEFPGRFPGQYGDKETSLSYNMARDYSATTGTYVQSDPIGLAGGLNTYSYAMFDPISNWDSSGLLSCEGVWVREKEVIFRFGLPSFITCRCFWLCMPCRGSVIWSGNYLDLPSTEGLPFYDPTQPPDRATSPRAGRQDARKKGGGRTSRGGDMGQGNTCFCKFPGDETGCPQCYSDGTVGQASRTRR